MRLPIAAAALVALLAASAEAAYDKAWYIAEYWSGEWPNGFAVIGEGVAVPARSAMDKDAPPSITCALPYKAVFHPWNEKRTELSKAQYVTASRIVQLKAKKAFTFQPDEDADPVPIKKGDTIQYLIYGAEGYFTIAIKGREYTASQELLDNMQPVPDDAFVQEEWLHLRCENGKRAWIAMDDVRQVDGDGMTVYADGLRAVMGGMPGVDDYGMARDLTDAEADAAAASEPVGDGDVDVASTASGYDDGWYTIDFWSGEYPNGIAVAKEGVVVQARAAMDKSLTPSVACALPYKANFHPWNAERSQLNDVRYVTASRIVPLTVKAAFTFLPYEEGAEPIEMKPGDVIEYLIYGAEGSFTVRIGGTEYTAGQELFENIEEVGDDDFLQEEWLSLRCEGGEQAWIYINDLTNAGADGQVMVTDGLWVVGGGGPGFVEYGVVRDLTDAEIAAGDPNAVQ